MEVLYGEITSLVGFLMATFSVFSVEEILATFFRGDLFSLRRGNLFRFGGGSLRRSRLSPSLGGLFRRSFFRLRCRRLRRRLGCLFRRCLFGASFNGASTSRRRHYCNLAARERLTKTVLVHVPNFTWRDP